MVHAFIIEPGTYNAFDNEDQQIEQCKEWGLLSDKATRTKSFYYKGNGMNLPCRIIGYVDKITAVITFDDEQKHCIHPSYLKEMQAANYAARAATQAEEAVEPVNEQIQDQEAPAQPEEAASSSEVEAPQPEAPIEAPSQADAASEEAPQAKEKPAKTKAVKEKKQKLELPEEKVKMTATVAEFTTVPNNFSDNDDEVIIYEAVSILEPELAVGTAWSSHSATIKKLELAIGDTITFEAKVVTKKLSKHPVPYKINNPAKIQKQQV